MTEQSHVMTKSCHVRTKSCQNKVMTEQRSLKAHLHPNFSKVFLTMHNTNYEPNGMNLSKDIMETLKYYDLE